MFSCRGSALMQHGAHFFQKGDSHAAWAPRAPVASAAGALPCSVALKVLGATSAALCSNVMFSNIWGLIVLSILHLGRSRALFSDSPWTCLPLLEALFFLFFRFRNTASPQQGGLTSRTLKAILAVAKSMGPTTRALKTSISRKPPT